MIVIAFVGIYMVMIRPQRRRQQQLQQQQNSVRPGARVRTTAGMYATVVAVDDDDVVLEVAPDVEVRYMKRAIMDVISPGEEPEGPEDSYEGEDTEDTEDVDDSTTDESDESDESEEYESDDEATSDEEEEAETVEAAAKSGGTKD
ncbi:MAG: preprotein translocase subunit YajC [Nocardiopsaceae bacterium]|nr:preprotein translocase subunit YajC [Nocardiopsaceae bacterium]